MYFADNALATFYYGINEKPTAIIKGNHISVLKGSSIILDGSESYDNDLLVSTKSLKYIWGTGETTDKITVFPNGTTEYSLKVEDEGGAFDETTITRTNCWIERLDEHTYRLGAVLEDVKDKYFFEWYDEFDSFGNNWCIEVSPPCDNTYFCKITDKETNESDVISLFVESKKRILHAKNPETGEIQEIYVYPNTNNLNGKFIECKVDGYIGYIAYDVPTHKNASILNCSVNGEVFKILKRI